MEVSGVVSPLMASELCKGTCLIKSSVRVHLVLEVLIEILVLLLLSALMRLPLSSGCPFLVQVVV